MAHMQVVGRRVLLMLSIVGGLMFAGPTPGSAQEGGSSPESFRFHEQVPKHVAQSWTVENGLPLNVVWALEQTQDGMLWAGTLDGLASFDGHSFTTYTAADTEELAGNRVFGLHTDVSGTLWIGTSTGVSIYRDGRFRLVAGASSHVEHFGEGPSGTMWMGGRSGLYRATSSGRVRPVPLPRELRDGNVTVAVPHPDSVWVASEEHVRLYHDGRFQRPGRLAARIEGRVSHLATSPTGTLWVAAEERLFAVRGETLRSYVHAGGEVSEIRFGPSGTPWLTTEEAGLLRVANDSLQHVRVQGELGSPVRGLVRDASGQWWVGEEDHGLVRLRPRLFWTATNALPGVPGASSVYTDHEGAVWAGVHTLGLFRFTDTTRSRWTAEDGLLGNGVRTIHQDETGAIWVGNDRGLARRRGSRFEEVQTPAGHPFTRMSALERDTTGTLWIAALKRGLYRYRSGTLEQVLPADSLFSSRVLGIRRAQDGSLWVGTQQHGVARWRDGTLTWYDGDDGVPYKSVRDIYQTDDGTIWISTSGGGIARFEGDHFTAVTPADGLPHRSIHLIREVPEGVFWMTSNGGVFRVRRSQVEAVADGRRDRLYAQTFGTEDGMPARECNGPIHPAFGKDGQDRLWIPTVDGLTVVDSRSSQLAVPDSLPVRVTGVQTDGQSHPLDSLRFAPSTYRVTLDFTAISLRHADDLSFRYRLDDESWTPARGRRTAEFTNLEAGTHRFEVQATVNGETWYRPATPLRFTVAPHFYETGWFRLLVLLSVLTLGVGAYRWRVHRLQKRQDELQRLVEERTRDLAEEKKKTERQAERLAELDEAKNRFFAHISHEFRTPLSLILSPLRDLLQRASDGAATISTNQLRRMARNAERLQRLIDQLLDLATLEAGRMELDRRPGDLASLVERSAEAFRSKAEQKGLSLRVQVPEGRIETRFDPEKVETIVSNLVSNAVKFTSDGGTVTVRVRREGGVESVEAQRAGETDAGAVRIEVDDTGPGIDPLAQERIFDRFEHVDNSTTREHEGTGLGLALTSELVELHGGTIEVDSTPGEGATFTVQLPLVPVAETAMGERERGREREGARGRKGEGGEGPREEPGSDATAVSGAVAESDEEAAPDRETILVVEDNAEMRAYLREQLSEAWAVVEAVNGEEGWERLQDEAPALVLSDVMMPEMDGYELCRRIKDDEALRTIPVLLLTARAGEEATQEGLRCGADDYVAKPFSAEELRQRIENHLAARRHLQARYREEVNVEGAVVDEEHRSFMERLVEVINERLSNPDLTVGDLAEEMALSRRQFARRVKEATGEPPGAFLRNRRIERAKAMLEREPETIAEVAYAVGFQAPSAFSQSFRKHVGCSPSTYVEERGS